VSSSGAVNRSRRPAMQLRLFHYLRTVAARSQFVRRKIGENIFDEDPGYTLRDQLSRALFGIIHLSAAACLLFIHLLTFDDNIKRREQEERKTQNSPAKCLFVFVGCAHVY
jgi:hypothetical protein